MKKRLFTVLSKGNIFKHPSGGQPKLKDSGAKVRVKEPGAYLRRGYRGDKGVLLTPMISGNIMNIETTHIKRQTMYTLFPPNNGPKD